MNTDLARRIAGALAVRGYLGADNFADAEFIIAKHLEPLVKENQELREALEALEDVSHVEGFTYDAIMKARAALAHGKAG